MWLYRESIVKILKLSEAQFTNQIKKSGQNFITPKKIDFIKSELLGNIETYFENYGETLEMNENRLKQAIRRMLTKNPPEKISIGEIQQSSDEVNLSTVSID